MKNGRLALCAMALLLLSAASAHATVITISSCFTGDCAGLTGSVDITITDDTLAENPSLDDVKVVIANNTNGFIESLGLFYTGGLPADTTIELFTGTGGTGAPSLTFGECKPDNSGQSLNVCFDFPQPNASRFDAGDTVTFFLDSDTAAILAASFLEDAGFAHINEVAGGAGSAKIVTPGDEPDLPEPASLLLFGSGLVGAVLARRRRMSQR